MTPIVENTKNFIYWPDEAERRRISHWFEERYKIPDCCGVMDGTHVHIKMRPSLGDPETFWCHHHTYRTNVLAIVDHLCHFPLVQFGFPGSASDSLIQGNLEVFQDQELCLSANEYIMADAAFTNSDRVVAMYRRTAELSGKDPEAVSTEV